MRDPPATFQGLSLYIYIYLRRTSQGRTWKGKISSRVLVKRECSRYGHWVGIYSLKIYIYIYIRQISCPPFLSPEDRTMTAKSRNFSNISFFPLVIFFFSLFFFLFENLSLALNWNIMSPRVIET